MPGLHERRGKAIDAGQSPNSEFTNNRDNFHKKNAFCCLVSTLNVFQNFQRIYPVDLLFSVSTVD